MPTPVPVEERDRPHIFIDRTTHDSRTRAMSWRDWSIGGPRPEWGHRGWRSGVGRRTRFRLERGEISIASCY